MKHKMKNDQNITVSIGLPVFNGERFIERKITSLLEQSFSNFELIISDNNSTDQTSRICQDFVKKDKRIRYFRQEQNIGGWKNFGFVLDKAQNDYFLWTAVDDTILPQFIEKSLEILIENDKVSCVSTKMILFGGKNDEIKINKNDFILKKIFKKKFLEFIYMNNFSAKGNYNERTTEYIKKIRHNQIFYGVFRTEQIKKCFVRNEAIWSDACTIFNILKFGEIFVIDEILMKVFDGGQSRSGLLEVTKQNHYNFIKTVFPMSPFTKWCIQNLKFKIFLRHFDFFIKINLIGELSLVLDIIRKIIGFLDKKK